MAKIQWGTVPPEIATANLLNKWQRSWDNSTYGRWTYRLIPDIRRWLNRPCGDTDYFGYRCTNCGQVKNAYHTLLACRTTTHSLHVGGGMRPEHPTCAQQEECLFDDNMMESLIASEHGRRHMLWLKVSQNSKKGRKDKREIYLD